jgi:YNFM family putative membrane transporter
MLAGIVLTLFGALPVIVAGIACVTFGFFAGHAVASGWVGRLAQQAKGQAAALYLLAYYLGSSLVGSFGGHCWSSLGWPGVAGLAAAVLLAGGAAALWLWSRERIGAA